METDSIHPLLWPLVFACYKQTSIRNIRIIWEDQYQQGISMCLILFLVGQFSRALGRQVCRSATCLCLLFVPWPRLTPEQGGQQAGLMNAQLMVCVSWRYTWRIASTQNDSNVHNMRCLCVLWPSKTSLTCIFDWIINDPIFEWIHIYYSVF